LPEETIIGVDLAYATAIFAIPDDAPGDWKGVFCFRPGGRGSRGSLMLPLEGHRWIVTVGGRHGDIPPGDEAGFMARSPLSLSQSFFQSLTVLWQLLLRPPRIRQSQGRLSRAR
jgi:hypothetical protein